MLLTDKWHSSPASTSPYKDDNGSFAAETKASVSKTNMASAAVQLPGSHGSALAAQPQVPVPENPHHVQTTLNFFKANEDGSPPHPTYVGQPETYERPYTPLSVTVHDISGHELDYALDTHGFQLYYHESQEKDFLDDEKIKREYYPETEQLLKDAYVLNHPYR